LKGAVKWNFNPFFPKKLNCPKEIKCLNMILSKVAKYEGKKVETSEGCTRPMYHTIEQIETKTTIGRLS
jgi:hypothetical protein